MIATILKKHLPNGDRMMTLRQSKGKKRVTASRIYYLLFLLCLFTSPYTPLGLKFFLCGSGFVFVFCMIFKRKSLKEEFPDILLFISVVWIYLTIVCYIYLWMIVHFLKN